MRVICSTIVKSSIGFSPSASIGSTNVLDLNFGLLVTSVFLSTTFKVLKTSYTFVTMSIKVTFVLTSMCGMVNGLGLGVTGISYSSTWVLTTIIGTLTCLVGKDKM